jgi:hypothetical protein
MSGLGALVMLGGLKGLYRAGLAHQGWSKVLLQWRDLVDAYGVGHLYCRRMYTELKLEQAVAAWGCA